MGKRQNDDGTTHFVLLGYRVRMTYAKAVRRVAVAAALVLASLVYFSVIGQPLGTIGVAFFAWLLVKPELHWLAARRQRGQ